MKLLVYFIVIAIHFPVYGNDNVTIDKRYLNELKYDSAIYFYNRQIDIIENTNNDSEVATILIKRGHANELWNKYEAAILDYLKAVDLYLKQNDYNGIVIANTHLAELSRKTQNFEKANYYLNQAKINLQNKQVTNITRAKYYNRKAAIISETGGNLNQVLFYSNKVIQLAKSTNNKNLEATSLNEIGFAYEKRGNVKCVSYYDNAYTLFEENNDVHNAINVLINLSRYSVANENYENSLIYIEKGFSLLDTLYIPTLSIKLYYFQYQSLVHLERYKEANEALENYGVTHSETVEMEWNRSLKEVEVKYELDVKNLELEEEKNRLLKVKLENKNKSLQRNYIFIICVLLLVIIIIFLKLNSSLKQSLKQKEILLQEVHHRVKNNLTLLNSLLFLRGEASDDKKVIDVLNECQARVQTMSIVHQNLYDVDDASKVDFNKFIKELIVESTSIMSSHGKKINSKIETNKILLEMGSAVFLGLILNELITNSLKYAFNEDKTHDISVKLEHSKSKYTLSYSDSGSGLPESFDFKTTTGFGFKLISIMIDQIDGMIDYNKEKNVYTIKFKLGHLKASK